MQIQNIRLNDHILKTALCICAMNIMSFFWGHDGVVKYLFRYIPLCISFLLMYMSFSLRGAKIKLTKIDYLWIILFIYFFSRMSFNNISDLGIVVIFLFAIALICLAKTDFLSYQMPVKIMYAMSAAYILTVLLQLVYPEPIVAFAARYSSHVPDAAHYIAENVTNTVYVAGIVGSVAYTAGYASNSIVLLFLHRTLRKRRSLGNVVLLVISLAALIATGKRAHMLALILSLSLAAWCISERQIFTKCMKCCARISFFVILFIAGGYFFPGLGVFNRFNVSLASAIVGQDVTSGRLILYARALELFHSSPVCGIGWGNYDGMLYGQMLSAHNSYLQILCETGIIGLTLYMVALACTLYYTYKKCQRCKLYAKLTGDYWPVLCLSYSLYLQTFFILYGLTSSIFYYHGYVLLYFFAYALANSAYSPYIVQKQRDNIERWCLDED